MVCRTRYSMRPGHSACLDKPHHIFCISMYPHNDYNASCEILISKICFISPSCIRLHRRDERFEKVAVNSGLLRLLIALCVHCTMCSLYCVFIALCFPCTVDQEICATLFRNGNCKTKFFSTKMRISLIQHAAKGSWKGDLHTDHCTG